VKQEKKERVGQDSDELSKKENAHKGSRFGAMGRLFGEGAKASDERETREQKESGRQHKKSSASSVSGTRGETATGKKKNVFVSAKESSEEEDEDAGSDKAAASESTDDAARYSVYLRCWYNTKVQILTAGNAAWQ
jgi:hypothetical protein